MQLILLFNLSKLHVEILNLLYVVHDPSPLFQDWLTIVIHYRFFMLRTFDQRQDFCHTG